MSRKCPIKLYNALVCPYQLYCIEVWRNASIYIIDPLSKVQKRIIRLICDVCHTFNTRHLFTALKIMPLNSIINLDWVYLCVPPIMVSNLRVLLSYIVKIIIFIIITRQKKHLHTTICNTSHIYRSFYFQSIEFWNKLMNNK